MAHSSEIISAEIEVEERWRGDTLLAIGPVTSVNGTDRLVIGKHQDGQVWDDLELTQDQARDLTVKLLHRFPELPADTATVVSRQYALGRAQRALAEDPDISTVYRVVYGPHAVEKYATLKGDRRMLLVKGLEGLATDPFGWGSTEVEDSPNESYRKVVFGRVIVTYYLVDSGHIEVILIEETSD